MSKQLVDFTFLAGKGQIGLRIENTFKNHILIFFKQDEQ